MDENKKTRERPSDRNLLFGVTAVQLQFIEPLDFARAASVWVSEEGKDLGDVLVEMGVLKRENKKLLERLIEAKLEDKEVDVSATLESFGGGIEIEMPPGYTAGENVEDASLTDESGDEKISSGPEGEGEAGLLSFGGQGDDQASRFSAGRRLDDSERVTLEHPGRYTIKGEQGKGGIGVVMLAFDEHIGREVAVKRLLTERGGGSTGGHTPSRAAAEAAARFLREARITGQLEHPSVVPVYEIAKRTDGTLYYSMKLVRGETLRDRIAQKSEAAGIAGRLEVMSHFLDVCQAMAYAHAKGVIHRDLKPANVMVGEFGETVVLDWGLAKVKGTEDERAGAIEEGLDLIRKAGAGQTISGRPLGTPAYMSPEQAEGRIEEVDERSDVWSLGAILYEILAGGPPFSGFTAYEVMGKVIADPVVPVKEKEKKCPPELAAIAEKCLEKDPAKRYANAGEVAADVSRFMSGGLVSAYEYNFAALLGRFARRNWHWITLALAALTVTAVAGVSYYRVGAEKKKSMENELLYVVADAELLRKSDEIRAERKLNQFIEKYPEHARGYYERAQFFAKLREYDKAIEDYGRAIALNPEFAQAYNYRGNAYRNKGMLDEAIADYDRAIAVDPDFSYPFNNRGNAYRAKGELDKAVEDYTHAIELDPKGYYAYNNRALVHRDRGELEKALEDYDKAIEIEPDFATIIVNRGRIYETLGNREKAMADYDRAVKADRESKYSLRIRGNLRVDMGDVEGAIRDYSESLEIDPGYDKAYLARASAYQRLGRVKEAVADYETARELDPLNPEALNEMAWNLAACDWPGCRDGKKAVEYASAACGLTKYEDHAYLNTLAAAHGENGEWLEAVKWQEQAIALLKEKDDQKILSQYKASLARYRARADSDMPIERTAAPER